MAWEKTVDLNLTYKPKFLQGLSLRADVFNVFNSQTVSKVDEATTATARVLLRTKCRSTSAHRVR
jgi:hypothetical protein